MYIILYIYVYTQYSIYIHQNTYTKQKPCHSFRQDYWGRLKKCSKQCWNIAAKPWESGSPNPAPLGHLAMEFEWDLIFMGFEEPK